MLAAFERALIARDKLLSQRGRGLTLPLALTLPPLTQNEDILHDFSDCCSVWHDARSDARDMFGANDSAAGQAEFEKNASRLCLPLSVTDGLRQYMLR